MLVVVENRSSNGSFWSWCSPRMDKGGLAGKRCVWRTPSRTFSLTFRGPLLLGPRFASSLEDPTAPSGCSDGDVVDVEGRLRRRERADQVADVPLAKLGSVRDDPGEVEDDHVVLVEGHATGRVSGSLKAKLDVKPRRDRHLGRRFGEDGGAT